MCAAPIDQRWLSPDDPSCCETIHQLDHSVVADGHPLGDAGDGGRVTLGQPLDRQQELMLLRLQAHRAGRLLAEREKLSDLMPPFGQSPEVVEQELRGGQIGSHAPLDIGMRPDRP